MTTIKTLTLWLLAAFIFTPIGIAIGWAWRDMQLDFEPVYPDSPPNEIVAKQAELMRLGFYEGLNDGECGKLTLAAQLKYLCTLIEGETFNTIWDGYAKMPKKNK